MVAPHKILIIRLKSIGDVVLTLPAVNLVRDNYPHARISFLTSKENAQLASGFAAVDDVLTLDRAVYRQKNLRAIGETSIGLVRQLRRDRFSITIDLQGYGETALLTWLTGAPRRWGSVYRPVRRWAYTMGVAHCISLHPAEWHRTLLVRCGLRPVPVRNQFSLRECDLQAARATLAGRGCDLSQPILYLQPFTSSPFKSWPLEKYLAVARLWRERGLQVVFGGGPADRSALEPARAAGFVTFADVPRMTDAGLMKLSALIVGGDTGFLHLAVALGKRVLMLTKSVGPGSAVPLGHPDWIIASRDDLPVATISEEAVNGAIAAALDPARWKAALLN